MSRHRSGRSRRVENDPFPLIGKAWCWPGMVYIDISAARQSKKRQQTEPYWVGTVRTVSETGQTTQRNDQMCLSRHFVLTYLIKSPGKRRLTIRACTWRLVKVNICCFVLLNFDKVIKTRVKVCHTFLLILIYIYKIILTLTKRMYLRSTGVHWNAQYCVVC